MIKKISIRNFKCFQSLDISLNQLNILMGFNGTGKSTLLQSILLLHQSYLENGLSKLSPNGSCVELGHCQNMIYKQEENRRIEFYIEEDNGNIDLEYCYANPTENLQAIRKNISDMNSIILHKHINFLWACNRNLESVVRYLKCYGNRKIKNESLVLSYAKDDTLLEQTKAWTEYIIHSAILKKPITSFFQDMDVWDIMQGCQSIGLGIISLIPIVVTILTAEPEELLLIDHPETYLHPVGQSNLGEMVARASNGGVQVLLETHSDHIMNSLRRMVKEGKLDNEKVAIRYFGENEKPPYPNVYELHMDKNGKIDTWPTGFMDEWDKAMVALL